MGRVFGTASDDRLSGQVIGLAIEVHRQLGPGLLESAYEECLCYELYRAGIAFERQLPVKVRYKDITLDGAYRIDILVDRQLILELKAVEALQPIHEAQLLTYMKLSNIERGLILNFMTPVLKDGIKRMML